MGHDYTKEFCNGCQIPLSDGYTEDCKTCYDRRNGRLQRGQLFSETGFPGELIDNSTRQGRIVAGVLQRK